MLFRRDSWKTQLNSYTNSISNNNKNNNDCHTDYIITNIEIYLSRDENESKYDEHRMLGFDESIGTILRSNIQVVDENNYIHDNDEDNEGNTNRKGDKGRSISDAPSCKEQVSTSIQRNVLTQLKRTNFFGIFFNFM